jgi:hypothetical protein
LGSGYVFTAADDDSDDADFGGCTDYKDVFERSDFLSWEKVQKVINLNHPRKKTTNEKWGCCSMKTSRLSCNL